MAVTEDSGTFNNVLENELSAAYSGLRAIDENLRSLNTRLPPDTSFRGRPGRGRGGRFYQGGGNGILFQAARVDIEAQDPRIAAVKRRFSALQETEEDDTFVKRNRFQDGGFRNGSFPSKPSIASAVMAAQREQKSRDEAIGELKQTEKKEVNQRNRRMFGMLLGTLQKFKQDEDKVFKDQERKQKEFEKKLELATKQEQEEAEKQRQELLQKRREQQNEIRRIQRKKMFIEMASEWETYMEKLQNFIQTQTKPPIFYLPAKHTMRTIELHKKSAKRVQELINQHKEKLQRDLEALVKPNGVATTTEAGDSNAARSGPNKRVESSGSSDESESEAEDGLEKNGDLVANAVEHGEESPAPAQPPQEEFAVVKVEKVEPLDT